ncbi:hypothetical protein M2451_003569 [Dysgonomonas sp. PFB1-18]|uniref:hypothetical protein n=1 Tax=unclassified Dysgonomonas TaxID=2630389 RepID=UPI0024745A2E|nr:MULTISPECIES: hypothetical protein [unclassified Dysgonomonas]MDH6310815.1 hypothetical protein [Dysgonomonas sp. PF1-14]MDH6340665.1 hypothetical protein [Dysgonomonas sp. PF1-16]MDH6382228.1 hypothetical protein [Dysgonomonas sp. PFB1-18]MDH6399635.1 hypothetical protein [Dysgonomonas sp. PF1-23]
MKKVTILSLIIVFILSGCNKSIYYAYESDDFGYCTLELSRKKDPALSKLSFDDYKVIYRSARYGDFLFIETTDWLDMNKADAEHIEFKFGVSLIFTINEREYKTNPENSVKLYFTTIGLDDYYSSDSSLVYMMDKEKEDITLLRYKLFDKETGLIRNKDLNRIGIYDFPPIMHKVDKIDYSKLSTVIPKKRLKNPAK